MKRRLKPLLKRLLPSPLKAWLKRRAGGAIPPDPHASLEVVEQPDGSRRFTVDGTWTFLAPASCADDLNAFRTAPDGVAELSGIARWTEACGRGKGRGLVLFDVGAHAGLVSALFCSVSSANRAYGFEPSPGLAGRFEEIRASSGMADRITLEAVGIGAERGEIEMLVDTVGGFVQVGHFRNSMWGKPEPVRIPVETIGEASARLGIVPDCVKIDIEGYEFEAVSGALDFLAKHRPLLFFELHLDYLEQRGLSPKAVIGMLEECGYRFHDSGGQPLRPAALYDSVLPVVRFIARAEGAPVPEAR